jgi:hypothetical protein
MNAAEVIKTLISLGGAVKDIVSKHTSNGAVDWAAVVSAVSNDPTIGADVKRMIGDLRATDIAAAINEIAHKQGALSKGRPLTQLSNSEMLQYDDLADAKLVLAAHQLKAAFDQNFAKWLVENALPILKAAAPVVLPLLL